ncbi:MAG: DNA/RNA nuclease SfsA [Proteobacteria bacterium]|nr:DNA/RNA nuclease SfsA [Pseudomonadota bacterium]
MEFPDPLQRGSLLKRYKRFLADVRLESGDIVTAHCANTGTMLGLTDPGSEVWLSPARNPARKLRYTWELIRDTTNGGASLVGINTAHPNALVEEAVRAGRIPELTGYPEMRREVRYGKNSRIDLLLEAPGRPKCYVEVKNVHLRREPGLAEFPDSVTARGTKHLKELGDAVEAGNRAVMFYLVQRQDCGRFTVAADIDPVYAEALAEAKTRGVEAICYACELTPQAIEVMKPLEILS